MVNPMPFAGSEQTRLERRAEQAELRRSEADITAGRLRLRNQERLVLSLKELGRPTGEAERLAALLRGILTERERHRPLIVQRLAHLAATREEEPPRS
jgi:DnaJ-domain-containing protein 1